MLTQSVHVFLNGEFIDPESVRKLIHQGDIVIAVDGGYAHIQHLGLLPAMLIGDLDSIDPVEIQTAEQNGVKVIRFPTKKDQTDFELALDEVLRMGGSRVFIHAGLGGRLDHTLTNLAVMSSERYLGLGLVLLHGNQTIQFVRQSLTLTGKSGDLVSLIPWQGPVTGVRTVGLDYPLQDETLFPDQSRGVSNLMTGSEALVSIQSGVLLCIYQSK